MMPSWIHFTRGRFVRQARVGLGDLREEHLSRQGFAGPVAMLYRTDGPNEVVRVEGADEFDVHSVGKARVTLQGGGARRPVSRKVRNKHYKVGIAH